MEPEASRQDDAKRRACNSECGYQACEYQESGYDDQDPLIRIPDVVDKFSSSKEGKMMEDDVKISS